ncbi:hypothetical protein JHK86_026301 [Glycine max]|nr:hypothetical protein JHK86_026301 [Glycine max]
MQFLVALSRASSTVTNHCLRHLRSTCNVAAEKVTLTRLKQKHRKQEPITVVSTHDYPSAVHVDVAGIDVCHVGDSVSMVIHGHDTTIPITLEQMLAKRPLLVGDLPFGTYESSSNQAVDTAVRMLKEGNMDAIKLEGGSTSRVVAAKAIVEAGIAVMGHVGLTPQAISVLGGFRPQGRTVASAIKEAGCFSVVIECVPAPVAAAVTAALQIPTIGIGAGPFCSGQVSPKFCKQYACVGKVIKQALLEYKEDVINGSFPGSLHIPYKICEAEANGFINELQRLGLDKAASAAVEAVQNMDTSKSNGKGNSTKD